MTRWPVDAALFEELGHAFEGALPAAEDALRRQRRGGGDAVALLLDRRERKGESQGGLRESQGQGRLGGEDEPSQAEAANHDELGILPRGEVGEHKARKRRLVQAEPSALKMRKAKAKRGRQEP